VVALAKFKQLRDEQISRIKELVTEQGLGGRVGVHVLIRL
jgi:hypothetical protein